MQVINSFGLTTEDVAQIKKNIEDIAGSNETLDAAIRAMCEKYDAKAMVAGFLFYAGAFPTPTSFETPSMN